MSLADAVRNKLAADAPLLAAATGGVYAKPLRRTGPNATPDAFDHAPPHLPKPSIAVIDAGAVADTNGPPGAQAAAVSVWVRVPDTAAGALVEATMLARVTAVLPQTVVTDGTLVGYVDAIAERITAQPDPWVENGRMSYLRVLVATVA